MKAHYILILLLLSYWCHAQSLSRLFAQKYLEYQKAQTVLDIAHVVKPGMSLDALPYDSNSFDIVYAHHIIEHVHHYQKALKELIRVAKKEVFLVFSIPPGNAPTLIRLYYPHRVLRFESHYNKSSLDQFLKKIDKVHALLWGRIHGNEAFLHIFLKESYS